MNFRRRQSKTAEPSDRRLLCLKIGAAVFALLILGKIFYLQIIKRDYYLALAENRHSFYRELLPSRGRIFFQDIKTGDLSPMALNQDVFTAVADPKLVRETSKVAYVLAKKLSLDEHEIKAKLAKDSRYEIIKKQVKKEMAEELELENLVGVYFERQQVRFYPEKEMASQVVGFYGHDQNGRGAGKYGLEGYFDEILTGKTGYVQSEKDAAGGWLPLVQKESREAENGADLVLTLDRAVEHAACSALKEGMAEFQAKSGTVIVLNPKTGAIWAVCNEPGFNPNVYGQTNSVSLFNNEAIFTPYEPGSVFKAITMAAALDTGKVSPDTKYIDKGFIKFGSFTIKNATGKVYGEQTMTDVIKESINTGAIFAASQTGKEVFRKYAENFGFGVLSGVELHTEASGDISSLNKKGEIYLATASFGQGITATPLQLVAAFGALANQGNLYKPYIVSEVRYAAGRTEKKEPKFVRQVVSPRTARLLAGMLTAVVEEGYERKARVPGYFLAGKTGTAQIPGPAGKYDENATNQTFIGFGPVDDPRFVVLVKYVEPQRRFATYTAVPTFGKIADFLMKYLEIPPNR